MANTGCALEAGPLARQFVSIFRPFDYAPAQAVAFSPYLVSKLGKKWHIAYLDYAWGQSTKDAFIEQIKKNGGDVVGTTGVPLGTADMAPFVGWPQVC